MILINKINNQYKRIAKHPLSYELAASAKLVFPTQTLTFANHAYILKENDSLPEQDVLGKFTCACV